MEYGRPDIYVKNVVGVAPVEGVGTARLGVIGITGKGPVNTPKLVTSFSEYSREFGKLLTTSNVGYAVKGFFENGGSQCYVNRVVKYTAGVKTSASSLLNIADSTSAVIATAKASSDGVWGDSVSVEIKDISGTKFTVVVTDEVGEATSYEGLTMATLVNSFVGNSAVNYTVADETKMPAVLAKTNLAGGNDGIIGIADVDYVGLQAQGTGLYAFDGTEIDLLLVAGVTTSAVHAGMIAYCTGRQDCQAIIETPLASSTAEALAYIAPLSGAFADVYHNGLKVNDPLGSGIKTIAGGGHIAGVIARTDASDGVWKSPAGTKANILGIVGLEDVIKPTHHDMLNQAHINVTKAIPGHGFCVWGARTQDRGEHKYLNVQRTKLYVAKTLKANLKWVQFENNYATLQRKVVGTITAFLTDMWNAKGLKGDSPSEAFFVKCDKDNNPSSSVDLGKLYADIGIATQKPAEFVIFRLSLI